LQTTFQRKPLVTEIIKVTPATVQQNSPVSTMEQDLRKRDQKNN